MDKKRKARAIATAKTVERDALVVDGQVFDLIWRKPIGASCSAHAVGDAADGINHAVKMDKQALTRAGIPTGGGASPTVCCKSNQILVRATCRVDAGNKASDLRDILTKRGITLDNALF